MAGLRKRTLYLYRTRHFNEDGICWHDSEEFSVTPRTTGSIRSPHSKNCYVTWIVESWEFRAQGFARCTGYSLEDPRYKIEGVNITFTPKMLAQWVAEGNTGTTLLRHRFHDEPKEAAIREDEDDNVVASEPSKHCPHCGSDNILDPIVFNSGDPEFWKCDECEYRWLSKKSEGP